MFTDSNQNRLKIPLTVSGGMVWALGAWLLLDAFIYSRWEKFHDIMLVRHIVPYLFSCFFIVVMNAFTREDFEGTGFSEFNHTRARAFFFIGLTGLLTTFFAAVWIAVDKYLDRLSGSNYAGYGLIFAPFINIISAAMIRIGHW